MASDGSEQEMEEKPIGGEAAPRVQEESHSPHGSGGASFPREQMDETISTVSSEEVAAVRGRCCPFVSDDNYDNLARTMQNWWHMLNRENMRKGYLNEDGEFVVCRRAPPNPYPGLKVRMTPPGWGSSETCWGEVVSCYVRMAWDSGTVQIDDMFVDLDWWYSDQSEVRRYDTVNAKAGPSGLPAPSPVVGLRVELITQGGVKRVGQVDAVEVEMEWDDQGITPGLCDPVPIVALYWWENFGFDQFDSRLAQADHQGALTEFALRTERGEMFWNKHFHWLQRRFSWCMPRDDEQALWDFYLKKCAQLFEGPDYAEGGDRPIGGEKVPFAGNKLFDSKDPNCLALDTRTGSAATRTRLFRKKVKRVRASRVTTELDSDSDAPDEVEQLFSLGATRDRLEWASRKMLMLRLKIEREDLYYQRFRIILSCMLQMTLSFFIFILGSLELKGGRFVVLLATYLAGAVGMLSGIVGGFSCLPISPNEKMVSLFQSMQIWMISLLTTFMFVELRHLYDNELQCVPSVTTYVQADPCNDRGAIGVTLLVGLALFIVVFVGCHEAGECLDTINDAGAALDRSLLFRYTLSLQREMQAPLLHRRPLISEKLGPMVCKGWEMCWNWRLELQDIGSSVSLCGAFGMDDAESSGEKLRKGEATPVALRRASMASQAKRQSVIDRRSSVDPMHI
eukprot:Hpha_TRINITY_DN23276_c0_g1::TRINITY_DN23276_c0_g1_i1::g.30223::m.30223